MTTGQEFKLFKKDITEHSLNKLDECPKQLHSLNLRYCRLKQKQFWIELCSKKVTKIQELKLNYTDLQNKVEGLAKFIVLKKVQKLSLIDTRIQLKDLKDFEDELSEQDQSQVELCFLNLMHNTIEPGGFETLAKICNRLPRSIDLLDVTNCELDDKAVESFLDTISKGKVIKSLIMDENDEISPDGVYLVGKVAEKCKTVTLGLSGCSMEDEHLVEIGKASPKALRHLRLNENMRLSADGIIDLFNKWEWLETVDVEECWFGGEDLEKLEKELVRRQVISEGKKKTETRSEGRKSSDSTASKTESSSEVSRSHSSELTSEAPGENQISMAASKSESNIPTGAKTSHESSLANKPQPEELQKPLPPQILLTKSDDREPGKIHATYPNDDSISEVPPEYQVPKVASKLDSNNPAGAETFSESRLAVKPSGKPLAPRNLLAKFDDEESRKFHVCFSDDQPNQNTHQVTLYNSNGRELWRMHLAARKYQECYIGVCAIDTNGVKSEEVRSEAIDVAQVDFTAGSIDVRREKNSNAINVTFDSLVAEKCRPITLNSEYCNTDVQAIHANDQTSEELLPSSTTNYQAT